jgi:molybdate transport system regulatory protein
MEARLKVWIERNDEIVLSDWRVRLLEEVDRTGSLSRAAEALGVPYRTAWHKLKQMEQRLNVRLVASRSGGSDGGRSEVTPTARVLMERYRLFATGLQQEVDDRFEAIFSEILAGERAARTVNDVSPPDVVAGPTSANHSA